MGDTTGSIRKLILDGVTFDVMADANISEVGSGFENAGIPTSGRTLRKMTRRTQERTGVVVACNGAERDLLLGIADSPADINMSYETAAGDTYHATGFIEFENRETEESRATVTLIPRGDWQSSLAG